VSGRTRFSIASVLLVLTLVGGSPSPSVAKPRTPYRVSIYASAATVAAGQEIVFKGKVRPHGPQARLGNVKLQVVYDPASGFETSGLDKPDRYGSYAVTWSANAPGTYQVRARVAAGRNHGEGISPVLTVTVTP
jgi:hypothetical protein